MSEDEEEEEEEDEEEEEEIKKDEGPNFNEFARFQQHGNYYRPGTFYYENPYQPQQQQYYQDYYYPPSRIPYSNSSQSLHQSQYYPGYNNRSQINNYPNNYGAYQGYNSQSQYQYHNPVQGIGQYVNQVSNFASSIVWQPREPQPKPQKKDDRLQQYLEAKKHFQIQQEKKFQMGLTLAKQETNEINPIDWRVRMKQEELRSSQFQMQQQIDQKQYEEFLQYQDYCKVKDEKIKIQENQKSYAHQQFQHYQQFKTQKQFQPQQQIQASQQVQPQQQTQQQQYQPPPPLRLKSPRGYQKQVAMPSQEDKSLELDNPEYQPHPAFRQDPQPSARSRLRQKNNEQNFPKKVIQQIPSKPKQVGDLYKRRSQQSYNAQDESNDQDGKYTRNQKGFIFI